MVSAGSGGVVSAACVCLLQPGCVLALLAVGAAVLLWNQNRRSYRFPPGPPVLPILGSLPFMDNTLPFYQRLQQAAARYGPVCSVTLGIRPIVVISGYKIIREAFVDNAVAFAGRPTFSLKSAILGNPHHQGVGEATYSAEWRAQRHVMMTIMRSLGYGKSTTEEKITSECRALVEVIDQQQRQPWDPEPFLLISVTNVICHLLFGERYSHDDQKLKRIMNQLKLLLTYMYGRPGIDVIPLYRYLPASRKHLAEFEVISRDTLDFIKDEIQQRRDSLDTTNPPNDVIEAYLHELSNNQSKIKEDWIQQNALEFFVAGTDTSSYTLSWAFLCMILHPEIQAKVQTELDRVLDKGDGQQYRPVQLSDRSALPYVEATIMEVQRLCALAPLSLPHATTCDVELAGCIIPKGTQVFANIYGTSINESLWKDPMTFDPTRFLDGQGNLQRHDAWIPFSLGRRMCLGEQLARQELFLFFTTILHTFTLSTPEGDTVPTMEPQYNDVMRKPQHYRITATRRI